MGQQEDDATAYARFNTFCIKHFGAEKEPLVYEKFGKELKMLPGGAWQHISESSACIAFETNLPAKSYVEYGETPAYGKRTPEPERHFYLHMHYLKDLDVGKTYHYRAVSIDERGKKIVTEDATFKTEAVAGAIHVPGDLAGPPYVLDKAGATYVLTKDLTVDGRAFEVKADGITLDLGGHTVVYNNKTMQIEVTKVSSTVVRNTADYGVFCTHKKEITILNGHIKQGAGNNGAGSYSMGFNPIMNYAGRDTQVAGVTIEYRGNQMVGIWNEYFSGTFKLHHNVFIDHGTKVRNRHGAACRSILFWAGKGAKLEAHHNLVKRTRQMAIDGTDAYNNEIYIDSRSTNSYGFPRSFSGRKIHHNRMFGTGFHVMMIAWGSKDTINDNFIHLEGQKPIVAKSYGENARRCNLVAIRLTQYDNSKTPMEDNLYHDNTVVIRVREGSAGTGTWLSSDPYVKNLMFRNNTIKVLAMDDAAITTKYKTVACLTAQGDHHKHTQDRPPVIYRDNTFISNIGHVRLGDSYGIGSNHQFYNCRFIKVGNDPRYKTIRIGFWNKQTVGHIFRDCILEGGADFDSVEFVGDAKRDFTVQWTLTVKTAPGAKVTILDKAGKEVFNGVADDKGLASAPLSQYRRNEEGKTVFTPHTIKVESAGKSARKSVTVDRKQDVEVRL
jgi:hypothetical protein